MVLFDEIEKSHPDLRNILLQITDEGELPASDGRKVSFANSVVVMTSNIGAEFVNGSRHRPGFADAASDGRGQAESEVRDKLKAFFSPELLGRIDEVVVFNRLNSENADLIIRNILNDYSERAEAAGSSFEFSEEKIRGITQTAFDEKQGARKLRRAVEETLAVNFCGE